MKLYNVVSFKRKNNITTEIKRYYLFIPDFLNFIDDPWKHSGIIFNQNNTFKLNSINYNIEENFEIEEITKENIENHKSNLRYIRYRVNSINYKFMLSKTEIIVTYMKNKLKNYLDYLLGENNGNL